jgi:putative transcription factor
MQNFQDWKEVSWNKTGERKKDETNNQYINRLKRTNSVIVSAVNKNVYNKQSDVDASKLRKIEKEEDTFIIPKVTLSMGKKISQLRCEKKMTQKDLALQLSLNVKIIQDYESSKAIPNPNIINKLERVLGRIRS